MYDIYMYRLLVAAAILVTLVSISSDPVPLPAALVSAEEPMELQVIEAPTPAVSALAYGVFDMETGQLLFAQNAEEKLPIASVTKLFTAAAVLQADADTPVTITATDVATEGRAGKLEAGQVYTPHELLFPLLLESSNDAGAALTRTFGPVMLAGQALADGSGLSAQNQASVAELAAELSNLYHTTPHIFDITTLSQKVGEYTGWVNNSPVRELPGYRGGKHGYTDAAGRTLAAVFAEPALGGRELGYVLLHSDDVVADTKVLRSMVAESLALR